MKADLSIIVTSYNKTPEQILECFQSIKDQTIQPKEIILVDDCSKDPRAHAMAVSILLPKNGGVAHARDVGVRMSTGKLLLFVDVDDKLAPDFIEQCGRVMTTCDIAYPNVLLFGDVEVNQLQDSPKFLPQDYFLGKKCEIVVSSMMRREVYESLGGFRDLQVYEDWDFWLRAMGNGYTFKPANTILWYRQQKDSRNTITHEIRQSIWNQITAPYEVQKGVLCKKSVDLK